MKTKPKYSVVIPLALLIESIFLYVYSLMYNYIHEFGHVFVAFMIALFSGQLGSFWISFSFTSGRPVSTVVHNLTMNAFEDTLLSIGGALSVIVFLVIAYFIGSHLLNRLKFNKKSSIELQKSLLLALSAAALFEILGNLIFADTDGLALGHIIAGNAPFEFLAYTLPFILMLAAMFWFSYELVKQILKKYSKKVKL